MSIGVFGLLLGSILAGEGMVNLNLSSGDYWRGIQFSDSATFQPELGYTVGHWTALAWGSMDLTNENDRAMDFNRTELTLQFDWEWHRLWMTTGLSSQKTYIPQNETTHEWFGGLHFDALLQPAIQIYYDFDKVDGWYGQLGVFPVLPVFQTRRSPGLELSAIVGFGSTDFKGHYFRMNPDRQGDIGDGHGGHGGDGHQGDGSGGQGSGDMSHSNANSSSGVMQASLALDYPVKLSKGMLVFGTEMIMYLDDDIRSPMNEQDDRFWLVQVSYRMSF